MIERTDLDAFHVEAVNHAAFPVGGEDMPRRMVERYAAERRPSVRHTTGYDVREKAHCARYAVDTPD